MVHEQLQQELRSVAAGLLTPFETDSNVIRHHDLAANAQWLANAGINLFLACANISEYHSLSHAERIAVTETSVKALPGDACIVAGVGGSTGTAIDLIKRYEEIGVDAVMVMPPIHAFLHERGLVAYYHHLADAADVGVVPYIREFDATADLVASIVTHANVVGVKWAIPDLARFRRTVQMVECDVVWINGLAEPLAPAFWLEGAEAFSAGVTNFAPRVGLELINALRTDNWKQALAIRDVTLPYMELRSESGVENTFPGANSIPAVKYGLNLAGQYGGPVRDPLVDLSEPDKNRAREYYKEIKEAIQNDFPT